ncbi:two-component system response regulator [Janibacter sp. Soil728]|uniref:response regulator n=1 Tax=Janibacter sp. Soil728 TaxID=1736393 RepID=UPI0006FF611A|nr:response regulator [Janibacter sp. Soil728]KRE37945.1 two-component system response regulator [Janibacter sp. Soil728]
MSATVDVLVVDDDFLVVKVHTRFVESVPGFRVVATAASGQAALDAVRDHGPQLVLLDVHLPDMTGIEVLRRLRAEGAEVGVLMVTAAREVEQVRAARSGGAFGYLVKPFGQIDLAARLEDFRSELQRLEQVDAQEAEQEDIDAIFGGTPGAAAASAPLPKGLSAETGELVLAAVRESGDLSASECGDLVGLARVTARRYLEHFAATGVLDGRQQYGRVGRPERRYRSRNSAAGPTRR